MLSLLLTLGMLVGVITTSHAWSVSPISISVASYTGNDCTGGSGGISVEQGECLQIDGENESFSPATAKVHCPPEPVPCAEIGYYSDSSCNNQLKTKKVVLGNCQGPLFSQVEGENYQFVFDTPNSLTVNTNCSNSTCLGCSDSATLVSGQCQSVNGQNMMLLSQTQCTSALLWVFPNSYNCDVMQWTFQYPSGECADGNGKAFTCESFTGSPEFRREPKTSDRKRVGLVGGEEHQALPLKKRIRLPRRPMP
jgi:hypothetical protein